MYREHLRDPLGFGPQEETGPGTTTSWTSSTRDQVNDERWGLEQSGCLSLSLGHNLTLNQLVFDPSIVYTLLPYSTVTPSDLTTASLVLRTKDEV